MFAFLTRLGRLFIAIPVLVGVIVIAGFSTLDLTPVASHNPSGTSTLSLVLLNSTDGQAHWGQSITYKVSTSATAQPMVSTNCYQNGALVMGAVAGFYATYAWPGSQTVVLSSATWTGGAASCTARLYYASGRKTVTLTTLNFAVAA